MHYRPINNYFCSCSVWHTQVFNNFFKILLWCFILHFSLFDELSLNQTLIWTGYLRFMFHFLLYDIVISLRALWFEVISTWCANWLSVVLHQTLIRFENRCQQIAAIRIGINCNRKHNYKSPISDEISCPPYICHYKMWYWTRLVITFMSTT